jgi:hypothetical protein
MSGTGKGDDPRGTAICNMHQAFLEVLRHREQEILQFFAVLGPALGGFIWLLAADLRENPFRFVAGTYGVLLVLLMGAFYALALGYNYRYLTLQLAKLEKNEVLNLSELVLASWPREYDEFERRNRWGVIPWSTPPGIIKVFWATSLACILGVTIVASCIELKPEPPVSVDSQQRACVPAVQHDAKWSEAEWASVSVLKSAIPWVGGVFFALALLGPVNVGRKIVKAARREMEVEEESRKDHGDGTKTGT